MAEYIARVAAKSGKTLHTTEPHPTREDAARAAYKARPNARSVSTCIAHDGKESHRDIRWHRKDELMKESTPSAKGDPMKRSRTVHEGLAYLLEDAYAKTTVLLNAEAIGDKLQDIAENLSTVEAKDIMPLSDPLTTEFGVEVATRFSQVATEQVRQLITAVQAAKTALDTETQRMKQGVEGGDMSDMAMDQAAPEMDGPPPPPDAAASGLPEVPAAPPEEDAIGGGFAGRPRKEGAQPRGRAIQEGNPPGRPPPPRPVKESNPPGRPPPPRPVKEDAGMQEDFLDTPKGRPMSAPAIDHHPHKSEDFHGNIENLANFHGKAGKLARNIESMIDSEPLSGEERKALANVLSHFCGFSQEPAHWANAESKLNMSLQSAGIWDTSKPPMAKVVTQLRRLAHLISFKHEGMIENAIKRLSAASDPDGLVFTTFRSQLTETRDAQTAAIRTARTFAIDIEDVVSIVKEGAAKATCPKCHGSGKAHRAKTAPAEKMGDCAVCHGTGKVDKAIKEEQNEEGRGKFKVTYTHPDKKNVGNDRFETRSEAKKYAADLKRKGYHDVHLGESKKWVKPWEKKEAVDEDGAELMQNQAIFPVEAGANGQPTNARPVTNGQQPVTTTNGQPVNGQVSNGQPVNGQPTTNQAPVANNVSASTNKPLSPGDMRARQQQQQTTQAPQPVPATQNNTPQTTAQPNNAQPNNAQPNNAQPNNADTDDEEETQQQNRVPPSTQTRMAPTNNPKKQQTA